MLGPRKEKDDGFFELPQEPIEIKKVYTFQDLTKRAREVTLLTASDFYPYLNSQITLEEIPLDQLMPCARYVLRQNLKIQRALRDKLLPFGLDPCHLTSRVSAVRYSWGEREYVLVPPIVEESRDDGGINIITDGLHRIIDAKARGEKTIIVMMIRKTAMPLPVMPIDWDEVRVVESVPPLSTKRKLRFGNSKDMLFWFGLTGERLERVLSGIKDRDTLGYTFFFRNLNMEDLKRGHGEFAWEEECRRRFRTAEVIVTNLKNDSVVLLSRKLKPELWGNVIGEREIREEPEITAAKALQRQIGISVKPFKDLKRPLILIDNFSFPDQPRVRFIYCLPVDLSTQPLTVGNEIQTHKLFPELLVLRDEYTPDLRLWGGKSTSVALDFWEQGYFERGEKVPSSAYAIDNWGVAAKTPFEKLVSSSPDVKSSAPDWSIR